MIDDLQWCDTDTLAVLEELCLSVPLIATVRPESSPADALIALLTDVGEVVELGPLDRDAARRLVEDRSPGAPTSDVDRWIAGASGNPLMLELAASIGVDADRHTFWCRGPQRRREPRRRVARRGRAPRARRGTSRHR